MMEGPIPQTHLSAAREYARAYARRHGMQLCDSADVEQEACIAAWKAWGRFDAGRGVKFRTFAWRSVGGAIIRWIQREAGRPGSTRAAASHVRIDSQGKLMRT